MGISISIKGTPLRLPAGTKADVEHINPLFADGLMDSHSLEMDIPVQGNEEVLGFNTELAAEDRVGELENATLGHSGAPMHHGVLALLNITRKRVSAAFIIGALVRELREITLPEALVNEVVDLAAEEANGITPEARPFYANGGNCQFPMHLNKNLYGSANPYWYPDASEWSPTQNYEKNDLVRYTRIEAGGVLNERIWQVTVTSTTVGDNPDNSPSSFRLTAFGIVNAFNADTSEFHENVLSEDETFMGNFHSRVPWFYLKWVMKKSLAAIGYRPIGEFMDDPRTDELTLPCSSTIDDVTVPNGSFGFRATTTSPVAFPSSDPRDYLTWPMPGHDESTVPNYDNGSMWDPTTRRITIQEGGVHTFRVKRPWIQSWIPGTPLPIGFMSPWLYRFDVVRVSDDTIYHTADLKYPNAFNNIPPEMYFNVDFPPAEEGNEFYVVSHVWRRNVGTYEMIPVGTTWQPNPDAWIRMWPMPGHFYEEGHSIACWLQSETPQLVTFADNIQVHRHVPDVPLESFLVEICEACNLEPDVDTVERTIRFTYRESVITGRKANISDQSHRAIDPDGTAIALERRTKGYVFGWDIERGETESDSSYPSLLEFDNEAVAVQPQALGEYAVIRSTRKLLKSVFYEPLGAFGWKHVGYHVPDVLEGDREEARVIRPACKPLNMEHVFLDNEEYEIPVMEDEGDSLWFHTKGERKTIYLCDFKRVKSRSGTVTNVPSARSWCYGWDASDRSLMNLLPDHENIDALGLWQYVHRNWARMLTKAEPVNMSMLIDVPFIMGREWKRIMHIQGQDYLAERLPVEYGGQGPMISYHAPLLRIMHANTAVQAPTWVDPVIACAGPGYWSFVIPEGNEDLVIVVAETSTGYWAMNQPGEGGVGVFELDAGVTVPGVYCCWVSDADGNPIADTDVGVFEIESPDAQVAIIDLGGINPAVMDLGQNGLTSCPDISHMTNLVTLFIDQNQITSAPDLSGNTQLLGFNAVGNAMTSVDSIFIQLEAHGLIGGSIDVSGGTNAAPTSASAAARSALLSRGYTLNFN